MTEDDVDALLLEVQRSFYDSAYRDFLQWWLTHPGMTMEEAREEWFTEWWASRAE